MNTTLNILKLFFIVFISSIILFSSYFFIFLKGDEASLSFLGIASQDQDSLATPTVLAEQLNTYLEELKSVDIDIAFFKSPEFQGLESFKIGLPTLQEGRSNPFEPVH